MATGIGSPLALGGLYPSVDGRYVAANGKPFTSVSNAESALNGFPSKLSESCIGLTVLVKESGWTEAKEYWVQPKGTTPETYGLVEKGTTDYNDLDNKPTIGDGTNTALPIVGNVKVTASTALGETAGVTVTPGQTTGEIEMNFTLPKGKDAYEVYLEKYKAEHSGSTDGAMSKTEWLASLKGADGADGATPTINPTTKRWEIHGNDTGVSAEGHNHNRGTYNVGDTFPSDGAAGDYIVVVDNSQATPTAVIYKWDVTQSDWTTTGVAPSDAAFRGGQLVPNTAIKDLYGNNVVSATDIISAESGKELLLGLQGFTTSETIDTTGVGGSYHYFPFTIRAGQIIKVKNNVGKNIAVKLFDNSNNALQTVSTGLFNGSTIQFSANQDSDKIGCYVQSDSLGTIEITFAGSSVLGKSLIDNETVVHNDNNKIAVNIDAVRKKLPNYLGSRQVFLNRYLPSSGVATYSTYWNVVCVTVSEGQDYFIKSFFGTRGSEGSKALYVFLDKEPVDSSDYTVDNVLEVSGDTTDLTIWSSKVTAPSGAKCLLVSVANQMSFDDVVVSAFEPDWWREREKGIFGLEYIAPMGEAGSYVNRFRLHIGKSDQKRLLTITSKHSGNEPYILFDYGTNLNSANIYIGGSDYVRRKVVIPPSLFGYDTTVLISASTSAVLDIAEFSIDYFEDRPMWQGGMRLNSHLGFQSLAPENTMKAFEFSAMMHPACIVNPIFSADNTLYCYHDGDATLTTDGTTRLALSTSEFNAKTDTDLSQYRVLGLSSYGYAGKYNEPIPTMEDFFKLCSVTGLRPMFSAHNNFSEAQWAIIKNLLDKYGLRRIFSIKAPNVAIIEAACNVLGNIDGYSCYISGNSDDEVSGVCNQIVASSVLNASKSRLGVEISKTNLTQARVTTVINSGLFCAVWDLSNHNSTEYRQMRDWGVTDYTEDYKATQGFNWL